MNLKHLIFSAVTAVAVGVGGLFYFKLLKWDDVKNLLGKTPISSVVSTSSANPKGYVAVYLTNGKVYFGKIEKLDTQEPVMSEVFFLNATATEGGQAEFQLVRLPDQFQGPIDQLTITRDHILFWEELASNSKVVQAIEKYHENQKKN